MFKVLLSWALIVGMVSLEWSPPSGVCMIQEVFKTMLEEEKVLDHYSRTFFKAGGWSNPVQTVFFYAFV